MILKSAHKKSYPKFYYYVKHDIPKIMKVPSITAAIKKFSGKTKQKKIEQSLRWGFGPTIQIVAKLKCASTPAYGCYKWGGNIIQIDKSLVDAFESGKDIRNTKKGKKVHVAGVTLLHELTHWADAKDGTDDPVPGDPSNEEGEAFEKEVYGKIINL